MKFDNSKVRRQDRLLDEARAREILANAEYGYLSIIDLDGEPYGVPVNFVWDSEGLGDCIYLHCASEGRKIDILECHDHVSFCVVGNVNLKPSQFTTEYESIILTGEATICTGDEERMYALELLLKKFSPNDIETGMKYARKSFYRTEIVRIDIETWSGKCKRGERKVGRGKR
ncbi:MAG: pyridoxamine 5'-phosphate oxidase family protein [Muribaculaceae bacterium]|nr:pyridoxamine 5'-phosphate oxidase family protein [Muribaculaceae bacterium]